MNVAVIGCGRIAQLAHLQVLRRLPAVKIVAVAEPDPARCDDAARLLPGAARFTDYRELLAAVQADAVVLTLPPALHAEAAVAAFDKGHHVYLEKPVATSLTDAAAVVKAWKQSGRVGMMGFNYRFHPLYRAARAQLRNAAVGDAVAARTIFSSTGRSLPDWKRLRQSGGGALLDLASHHIDLVSFLIGDAVVQVSALVRSRRTEGDTVALQLGLAGGLLVQTFCSIDAVSEDRFEIYGRQGTLKIDRYAQTLEAGATRYDDGRVARVRRELRHAAGGVRRILRPAGEPSYAAALRAFAAAVSRGRPAEGDPSVEDGYRSLAVVDAAERSGASGQVVTLAAESLVPPDARDTCAS